MRGEWFTGEEHRSFTFEGGPHGALLLHGFMGTPAEMRPLGETLRDAGFTASGPLLPGFGADVQSLNSITRSDWLQAAERAWKAVTRSDGENVLVGFSMGGAIAIHLAHKLPPERLVLIAPLWKLLGGDWKVNLLPVAKRLVRTLRPFGRADFGDPDVREFFSGAMPDLDLDDPEVQHVIRNEIAISTRTLDELRRIASEASELVSEINVPTLVIQGSYDTQVRSVHTRELVGRMGNNARLVELPSDHILVSPHGPAWPSVQEAVRDFVSVEFP